MLGPAGLSSDSGLGGSTDGSTDILLFGSVVDSVTEEGMCVCVLMPKYYHHVVEKRVSVVKNNTGVNETVSTTNLGLEDMQDSCSLPFTVQYSSDVITFCCI